MTNSLYEQLKDDLGYLGMNRSAECFATLAEEAKAGEWSHIEFLARVIGEQTSSTVNRKLAARLRFARFPFRRTLVDFDFQFQPRPRQRWWPEPRPNGSIGATSPPPTTWSTPW